MNNFTQDQILELIQLYKENSALWNKRARNNGNPQVKQQIWEAIGEHMGLPVDLCKRKMNSLLAQVRAIKARCVHDRTYRTQWYAYKYFSFLTERSNSYENSSEYKLENSKEENSLMNDNASSEENFEFINTGDYVNDSYINDTNPLENNSNETKRLKVENNKGQEMNNTSKKLQTKHQNINFENNLLNEKNNYPVSTNMQERDEYEVYGETVGHRLRKIKNPKKICILKHKIDVLLYEAELECYNNV